MKTNRKLIIGAVLMMFYLATSANVYSQGNIYKLHSLFLYNFTKQMQWNNVGNEFVIGVYGSAQAFQELDKGFAGKQYKGKNIRVVTVSSPQQSRTCQIVYLAGNEKNELVSFYNQAKSLGVLFVSEDDLVKEGLPISFLIKNNRLAFKLGRSAMDETGIRVSSSLLSLAILED